MQLLPSHLLAGWQPRTASTSDPVLPTAQNCSCYRLVQDVSRNQPSSWLTWRSCYLAGLCWMRCSMAWHTAAWKTTGGDWERSGWRGFATRGDRHTSLRSDIQLLTSASEAAGQLSLIRWMFTKNRRISTLTSFVSFQFVSLKDRHADNSDNCQSIVGQHIGCFLMRYNDAYAEPIININPTEIFFCKGNCSLLTSYTGMATIIESTIMLMRQLIRTAASKLMHLPGNSFVQPSHVKCTGRHRRESMNAQLKPMAALIPIRVYAR